MNAPLPRSLESHRIQHEGDDWSVVEGEVRWSASKSLWLVAMGGGAVVGGLATISWSAIAVFLGTTAAVLLLGHSLGSHRKLIHDSYGCPKWLEYFLVWCGVQVGLAGPIGLLRQHELRDFAQRLPDCHPYLRHGRGFWADSWWQLHCELRLARPPLLHLEPRIADDRFYRFLERTWMWQQLPPALALYALGGWGFVFWGTCARVTAGVVGHWLIGWFAHNAGGRHFDVNGAAVQGHNIPLTSLMTMGESWHNNHHAFPGSARLGLADGEWDPGWWLLVALRRVGLAWNFRLPHALAERPELQANDAVAAGLRAGIALPAPLETKADRRGLRALLADAARSLRAERKAPLRIEWPGTLLSARGLRALAGAEAQLVRNPKGTWLRVIDADGRTTVGLAGLCLAWARRGAFAAATAMVALPAAFALDRMDWRRA
jgi:fatty-acid desaturase